MSDLFGEDSCFADADLLWQKQNEAIATKRDAHRSGLERVADANVSEKTKAKKQIIRDCLAGANGRAKVEGWLPGTAPRPTRS